MLAYVIQVPRLDPKHQKAKTKYMQKKQPEGTKHQVPVTSKVECVSREKNVPEGREVTNKDPTLEELARCPRPWGCLWVVSAKQTQSKHTVNLQPRNVPWCFQGWSLENRVQFTLV